MVDTLSIGAVVRSDGEVVPMRFYVREDRTVRITDLWGGHPAEAHLDQEGSRWARGEWDSPDVVVFRALTALGGSR